MEKKKNDDLEKKVLDLIDSIKEKNMNTLTDLINREFLRMVSDSVENVFVGKGEDVQEILVAIAERIKYDWALEVVNEFLKHKKDN